MDRDGCRTVVAGIRFAGGRIHARAIVVLPDCRRRKQRRRLRAAPRYGDSRDCLHAHRRVRRGNGRVRRVVEVQCRGFGLAVATIAHRCGQGEPRPDSRPIVADRRCFDHQVELYRRLDIHLRRRRAVVGRVGLVRDRVHAGAVVVRARRRRRGQRNRLRARARCGQRFHGDRAYRSVGGRDRRVRSSGTSAASSPPTPRCPSCAPSPTA